MLFAGSQTQLVVHCGRQETWPSLAAARLGGKLTLGGGRLEAVAQVSLHMFAVSGQARLRGPLQGKSTTSEPGIRGPEGGEGGEGCALARSAANMLCFLRSFWLQMEPLIVNHYIYVWNRFIGLFSYHFEREDGREEEVQSLLGHRCLRIACYAHSEDRTVGLSRQIAYSIITAQLLVRTHRIRNTLMHSFLCK